MIIPLLDANVPQGQYEQEGIALGSKCIFKNISPEDALSKDHEVIVVTDKYLPVFHQIRAKHKIIWLMEPASVLPQIYQRAVQLAAQATLVFSHAKDLLDAIPNGCYCPWGSYFIKPEDHKLYEKRYNSTVIVSSKTYSEGHKFRHAVVNTCEEKFDHVRRGGTAHAQYQNAGEEYKLNFLKDFRFAVEVENGFIRGYFTEKILDCLRTGVIPIYKGDPDILQHFNPEGIICFNEVEEVGPILDSLSEELYQSKLGAVKENYTLAEKYLYPWKHIEEKVRELL